MKIKRYFVIRCSKKERQEVKDLYENFEKTFDPTKEDAKTTLIHKGLNFMKKIQEHAKSVGMYSIYVKDTTDFTTYESIVDGTVILADWNDEINQILIKDLGRTLSYMLFSNNSIDSIEISMIPEIENSMIFPEDIINLEN